MQPIGFDDTNIGLTDAVNFRINDKNVKKSQEPTNPSFLELQKDQLTTL